MPERHGEFFAGDFAKEGSEKPSKNKNVREILFLAEQAAEGGMKVLPGKEWAFHYPVTPEVRAEKLQGLMSGKYEPSQVAHELKPDALLYNPNDIESQGLDVVSARVLDATAQATQMDYGRYAKFLSDMKGLDTDLGTADNLYQGITRNRIQKKMRDSYGITGQRQMDAVLRREGQTALADFPSLNRTDKVLSSLKLDWLCEDFSFIGTDQRDAAITQLSGEERALFNSLKESYRKFVHEGDESAYQELTKHIREQLPAIQGKTETNHPSESMQKLDKDLEKYKEEATAPGSPEDTAIPPEDEDEYHTPESNPGESKEKVQARPIFEIQPPLQGYYASGRKSYYDVNTLTWSKKKQLQAYAQNITDKAYKISGATTQGLKSLPLPNGYALDISSLETQGAAIEVLRDQNGCFYIQSNGGAKFSVEFGKEDQLFTGPTIPEDLHPLYRGQLSSKSEDQINRLVGGSAQKATQVQAYILANHFYPGGGDLEAAGALQLKLRKESTGDNYLQNIDASEYLECYSSNTLGIAMLRAARVEARLVVGYKVEGSVKGKSQITQSTGHAWSEIWDGQKWTRFDFTPAPKPEDKKDSEQSGDKKDKKPAENADDGGAEQSQSQSSPSESGKQQGGENDQESQSQGDAMGEASDGDISQGEQQLQEAQKQIEQMAKNKQALDEKIDGVKEFKDLEQLQNEIKQADLLDDMKEDLADKLDAKEDIMKDELKEKLGTMAEDGFLDEEKREALEKLLDEKTLKELDALQQQIEKESRLYNEYDDIREEVRPLVDTWFEYFVERLPREEDVHVDEDSRTRQGSFDRKSIQKARNLIFGTVKNPRILESSVHPLFLASVMVDVSGSMGEAVGSTKLNSARKLLVFYSELFSRIHEAFGYLRFSINVFADNVVEIKSYDQDYDSPKAYQFPGGTKSTVKVRLMQNLRPQGGTNMLDSIKKAASDLNEQTQEYPDYASAFYFIGDGEDTNGNSRNVKKFLEANEQVHGFGDHMRSAIMLGDQSQKQTLSQIFGEEHTTVAPDFESLIEQSMLLFNDDIEEYLKSKAN